MASTDWQKAKGIAREQMALPFAGMTLGDVARGRDNNLNFIRAVAASAVLVSHAWPVVYGSGATQPLEEHFSWPLSTMGLFVFFAVSGFLITASFERRPNLPAWLLARALRLFPALAVVLLLTVLVLGPLTTNLSLADYFGHPDTLAYFPFNLSLAFRQDRLPGVFEELPYGGNINVSHWTLFYEVLCYAMVLLAGIFGLFQRGWRIALFLIGFLALYAGVKLVVPDPPETLVLFTFLGLPFAIGMAFWFLRDRIVLSYGILLALAALTWASRDSTLYSHMVLLTLIYGVFVVAYRPGGYIRRYNRIGDYSYGLYVYGFAVQQAAVLFLDTQHPLTNIAVAFPITLALAILSWRYVEEPALRLARAYRKRTEVR